MTNSSNMRILASSLALVAALTGLSGAPAHATGPSSCGGSAPATSVFSGSFPSAMQGSYVQVPFDVPAGVTKVALRFCYDQPPAPTASTPEFQMRDTLDLGLYQPLAPGDTAYGPREFRGWGGSSRPNQFVSVHDATVGFQPGEIPAGTWAAEIGVAGVPGIDGGDPDQSVAWRLEVYLTSDPSDGVAEPAHAPYDTAPAIDAPGWYKGDFHVHARNSNPNDASMRDVFDYAFAPRDKAGAGLDFITLSDYVGRRQWDEIGDYQADYPGKLIVRSAEVITYHGHVNNHGSHTYVDYRTGPIFRLEPDGSFTPVRGAQPASRIFDDIRAVGGWTQVNHPWIFPSQVPAFAYFCRGCSWGYSDTDTDWSKVDAYEVSTGPAGYYQPEGNEPGPNPFTPPAIATWDSLVDRGFHVTAVGSSDSHKANYEDLTTAPIGRATTVVYASSLSESGVGDAIRAGHAYVKFFSSDGPDLRFTAASPDGATAMMGDTITGIPVTLHAEVLHGLASPASPQPRILVVMLDGAPLLSVPVVSDDMSLDIPAVVPGHYRLQLQRTSAFEALTNPITVTR